MARSVITRLHGWLRASVETNGWPIGFSIGVLTLREIPETLEQVMRMTDAALYIAKRGGKNRIEHVVFPGADRAASP